MPPLEPDANDRYASLKPPVRKARPARPNSSATAHQPRQSPPPRDEYTNSELDGSVTILWFGALISLALPSPEDFVPSHSVHLGPRAPQQVFAPCSVCSDILEFNDDQDVIKCTSCQTTNIHLRVGSSHKVRQSMLF